MATVVVACIFTCTLGVVMRFPLEWYVGGGHLLPNKPSSALITTVHLPTHHHHDLTHTTPRRTIVLRELFSASNAIGPYICARFLCNLPLGYGPFLLATVIYWMTGTGALGIAFND